MTVNKRLSKLEKKESFAFETDPDLERRCKLTLILHKQIDNARKEAAGEEPEPLTPEEEEFERQDNRRFILGGGIEFLRNSPGWQTQEARDLLDEWERDFKAQEAEEAKNEHLQEG